MALSATPSHSLDPEKSRHVPYLIITGPKRAVLISLLLTIGVWSAISNSVYFPALPTLTKSFGVSPEAMNLSLVAYLICQGIVPTFTLNIADTFGRRPIILGSFCVYIGACIGISQCNAYWLLTFLRCVQAAGIAPVIAINLGISGDVCTPQDRGGFVGIVSGMLLVGQAFGSLLGLAFISRWGWRAIFVFLAIGAGVTFLFLAFLLPETCRLIVGNGLIIPPPIYRAPVLYTPVFRDLLTDDRETLAPKEKLDFLTPYRILCQPTVLAVLVPAGLQFALWTISLTSLATVLEAAPYHYTVAHVGLMYLPQGLFCLAGSILLGRVLNYYYKFRWQRYENKYPTREQQLALPFNVLRVRLDCALVPMCLTLVGLLMFGWVLERTHNVAAVVTASCFVSFGCSCFIAMVTTMLVDLYPGHGLASTSCVNFVRCLLAAGAVAALDKMTSSMGHGWTYTLMTLLCLVLNVALVLVVWQYLKHLKRANEKEVEDDTESTSAS